MEYVVDTEMGTMTVRTFPDQLFEEGEAIFVTAEPEYCHLVC